MVIVVMGYGKNMPLRGPFWEKIFAKMSLLLATIEKAKGSSMSIDDSEYRWVKDRLEYWDSEDRTLSKEEMKVANKMWKHYSEIN
jgi:hypothetical protein